MKHAWLKGILVIATLTCAASVWATVIASDDADNSAYDSGWNLTDNGGFGFGNWFEIATGGGGRFIATAPFQVVDGNRSWGLFASDTGNYAIGRPLLSALTSGSFSALARHNVSNEVGFTGITVYDTTNTELVRFGLNPFDSQSISVQFGSNTGSIPLGTELRGQRLRYALAWDASGAFTLTVARLDGPESGSFTGNWGALTAVAAFGFNNFNSGSFQDFIFDKLEVVPEPASLMMLGIGLAGLMGLRRRRAS